MNEEITIEQYFDSIKKLINKKILKINFDTQYASIITFYFENDQQLKINWDWDYFEAIGEKTVCVLSSQLQNGESEKQNSKKIIEFFNKKKISQIYKIDFRRLENNERFAAIYFSDNEGLFVYAQDNNWLHYKSDQEILEYKNEKFYRKK